MTLDLFENWSDGMCVGLGGADSMCFSAVFLLGLLGLFYGAWRDKEDKWDRLRDGLYWDYSNFVLNSFSFEVAIADSWEIIKGLWLSFNWVIKRCMKRREKGRRRDFSCLTYLGCLLISLNILHVFGGAIYLNYYCVDSLWRPWRWRMPPYHAILSSAIS